MIKSKEAVKLLTKKLKKIGTKLDYTNPIEFPEQTVVYAKDQPEYMPLPVHKDKDGQVIACLKIGLFNRLKLLFTGKVWVGILTFNHALQPSWVSSKYPFRTGSSSE